jgi:hypothetical protein
VRCAVLMEKLTFPITFSSINVKSGDNFSDEYEGRIILKWILKETVSKCCRYSSSS